MTYLKKINPDWQPQEHKGILVGDVVDFPGPYQKLVEEGNVVLCDKDGNEISAYDRLGVITNREMEEFKQWKALQREQALKATLEKEHDELVAAAAALKKTTASEATNEKVTTTEATVEDAKVELEQKKKDFAARMAAAKAKKAAEKAAEAQVNG